MNCDACSKKLDEYDTHEHILCTRCMRVAERSHCVRCHCVTNTHKIYSRITTVLKQIKPLFLVLGALAIIIGCIAIPFPMVAFKFLLGLMGILTLAGLLALFILLFFVLVYKFGHWLCKKIGLELDNIEDGPEGILIWFIGLVACGLPFGVYFVGMFVYSLIFRS